MLRERVHMKQLAIVTLAVLIAAPAFAQNKPAPAAPAKPGAPAAQQQTAQPGGRKQPQAKSKEEYKDFQTANALNEPAAIEKAADDFAAKYPDSELRTILYSRAMNFYQQVGDADKIVEMGRKSLAIDPDEPVTLASVASVLAERTRDTDLDKNERLDDATKYANHALETVNLVTIPVGQPAEVYENAKNELRSVAYAALGMVAYTKKNYPEAEAQFRKSIDVGKTSPDASIYLRLTLALDKQAKYADALNVANETLKLAQADSPVAQLATQEKDRLTKLAGAPKPAATPAAAPTPTTAVPK